MITKICPKCQEKKNITDFWKDKYTKDGYGFYCKECQRIHNKLSYQKNREKRLIGCKKYREENKNYYREYNRKYYKKNKQKISEIKKQYKAKHYHRFWARASITNHKKREFIIKFSIDELEKMAKETNYCPICGVKLNWEYGTKNGKIQMNSPTLDRMENNEILILDNIQILCMRCNATKLNRTMKEFIEYCAKVCNKFSMKYLL